jgi:hypothetical protein
VHRRSRALVRLSLRALGLLLFLLGAPTLLLLALAAQL